MTSRPLVLCACALASVLALAAKVDPAIRELERQAQRNAGRFAVLKKTVRLDPPPGDTNTAWEVRSDYQKRLDTAYTVTGIAISSNSVLNVNLKEAKKEAKKAEDVEKAAERARKKDQKTFNKWISDTEKARDKSSDEMAEFYQSILDLAAGKESE